MFRLTNKVAVVTGGASGIGLEISRAFARQGAIVHIFELNVDLAEREADLINAAGGQAYCHRIDVTKPQEVRKAIERITKEHSIDVLVNNAGVVHVGNVENTTEDDMDKMYATNIKSVFNCIQAVIPIMKVKNGGSIINMASVAATVGLADRFAYSMSKGAVYALTKQVAKDYVQYNIRCNSISPARVHTPLVDGFLKKNYPGKEAEMFQKLSKTQPIGRMGKAEEIGALAVFLASNEAAFITGCDYLIDGGFVHLNE